MSPQSAVANTEHNQQKAELVTRLLQFLPDEAVLVDREDLVPFECDGLTAYRAVPMLVVLPSTIAEVQQIIRLCHELKVPVVARGAGTSLSGGALPLENGVLLSLAKFNNILDVDTLNRTARVQPGVRNLAIFRSSCGTWALLRTRSFVANRVFHRGQCSRECRRTALSEIWPDRTQCTQCRAHHH